MILLFFGGFIVLIVILVLADQAQEKARQKRFAAFAAEQGWQYSAATLRDLHKRFPEMELFRRGSNRYAQNFLSGTFGPHALSAFDYHYQVDYGTGKRKSTQHHRFTVVMLQPAFPLKPLAIRNQRFFDRLSAAFGGDDINFESATFSRKYHVSSPERRWAFDVITARTMALLMDRDAGPMEMDHLRVMLPLPRAGDPEEILPDCYTAAGLLDGIPDYARQLRPPSQPPPLPHA